MIDGIQLKVCGLRTLVDAEAADRAGADFLGFNLYPRSPRHIPLSQYRAMAPHLPDGKKVAVMVEPSTSDLSKAEGEGFDFFQLHFDKGYPPAQIEVWSSSVGFERLWLAPRLPPDAEIESSWLELAKNFLMDTYSRDVFGGTGKSGDWDKFARMQRGHPDRRWILSGGLTEGNIAEALRRSQARFVDVNSGVESSPGVKDRAKLAAFVAAMRLA